MDRVLKPIFVLVEQSLDLQKVVLLESVEGVLDVVPHLGFNLAAAVCKSKSQIRLSRLLGLNLLGGNDETRSNNLVFEAWAI